MRYMMFIKHTEDYKNVQVPAGLYEAMGKFIDDATKRGQFVGGAGLLPTTEGSKVRLRGGVSADKNESTMASMSSGRSRNGGTTSGTTLRR